MPLLPPFNLLRGWLIDMDGVIYRGDEPTPGAAEFVAAARAHLGMSSSDAEALSMTELQLMLEMKFPQAGRGGDIPSEDEYEQSMQALCEVRDRHVASLHEQGAGA